MTVQTCPGGQSLSVHARENGGPVYDPKLDYLVGEFSCARNKRYESYVVNRIWAGLRPAAAPAHADVRKGAR